MPQTYVEVIRKVQQGLGCELWLTGGWLLADRLNRPYAGDVDLLAPVSEEFFSDYLSKEGFRFQRTYSGTTRVYLADENHLDVWPTEKFVETENIRRHLESFNFSSTSTSQNLSTGEIVSTTQNLVDLGRGVFRFNKRYCPKPDDSVYNMKTADTLISYFGLKPGDKAIVAHLHRHSNAYHSEFLGTVEVPSLLKSMGVKLRSLIPDGKKFFISRGFVRNALLNQISYWDDIDIVVQAKVDECVEHLQKRRIPYVFNYFGMPKVRLQNGQKVDVICISDLPVRDFLRSFQISVDQVAWDCYLGEFVEIEGRSLDIERRKLKINLAPNVDVLSKDWNYHALKAAYLIIKDGFDFENVGAELIFSKRQFSNFDASNAARLAQEILSRCKFERIEPIVSEWKWNRRGSAAGFLAQYLEPSLAGV